VQVEGEKNELQIFEGKGILLKIILEKANVRVSDGIRLNKSEHLNQSKQRRKDIHITGRGGP
jgi:hypothetical protein